MAIIRLPSHSLFDVLGARTLLNVNKYKASCSQLEWARSLLMLCVMLSLFGCGFLPVVDVPAEETATASKPAIEKTKKLDAQPQPTATVVATVEKITPLAILLSKDNDSFQQIANEITKLAAVEVELFYLQGSAQQQLSELDLLQRSPLKKVISIGSVAANQAKALTGKQVVFTQVFNYQQEGLLDSEFTGVSMIPSADALFSKWKMLSPDLLRVAIITGIGNREQILVATQAANKYGVQIEHREVSSDKEFLFLSKELMPTVQGFWLLPDNRVLSRRVIKDFLSYATQQSKQVALFHPQLMKFGGYIYVSSDPEDVARQALKQLQNPAQKIRYLERAEITINQQLK